MESLTKKDDENKKKVVRDLYDEYNLNGSRFDEKLPTYTGAEFNKKFSKRNKKGVKYTMKKQKPVKFYKVTCYDEVHRTFKYQTGLNIDYKPLGLFRDEYTGMQFVPDFLLYRHLITRNGLKWHVREVTIPTDANVCVLKDCFKTNMFVLGLRTEIWFDYDLSIRIVKKNGIALRWVYPKIVTDEMRKRAFDVCSQSTQFSNQKIINEEEINGKKVNENDFSQDELYDYWVLKLKTWLNKI